MKFTIKLTLWFLLLASPILALTIWGMCGLTQHAIIALDRWGEAAPPKATIESANSVVIHADTAFKNLADATGDWSDASKQQARDVRSLLAASGRAADALTEDAKALKLTIAAGTESAQALTKAVGTADTTIEAAQPVLGQLALTSAASTRAIDTLNWRMHDPQIEAIIQNIRGISDSGNGIMGDARLVADHETHEFLKPVKWYMVPIKRAGQGIDIISAVARNIP